MTQKQAPPPSSAHPHPQGGVFAEHHFGASPRAALLAPRFGVCYAFAMTRFRSTLPLVAPLLALACIAAAPAPKATAAKPAPKPAAKAPAKTAFDARTPQSLMDLVAMAGAKVQTNRRDQDSVFVAVSSTMATFSMQFAGCDDQGRACQAVLLDAAMERGQPSTAQINSFNQTSVMCRIYQDRSGTPHVVYSSVLLGSMTRDDAATVLLAWQGCLSDGRDFTHDPVSYLANAA